MLSKKVILIGKFGVGKTSLVRKFIYQKFSDEYLTTIGVKIDKKQVEVDGLAVSLIIWDLAGESSQDKIPASYKLGAHGVIYVFDLSRPSSYERIQEEIAQIEKLLPGVPIEMVGNKNDLVSKKEAQAIVESISFDPLNLSSAKTGDNVEELFHSLARRMVT